MIERQIAWALVVVLVIVIARGVADIIIDYRDRSE